MLFRLSTAVGSLMIIYILSLVFAFVYNFSRSSFQFLNVFIAFVNVFYSLVHVVCQ